MRITRKVFLACAAIGLTAATATAQDPVRLPGVSVKAAPPLPGPKIFAGIVRDTEATPLADVEVIIPALQRRVLTNADGSFRFADMPTGTFEMRARKIGFAPQVHSFKMEDQGGAGAFELVPWPYRMPPVVTRVARGGLSGTVADTAYGPVAGAIVTLSAKALIAETDSSGAFYLPAPPGSWILVLRKPGYADRMAGITIPADSGRHVSMMLLPEQPLPEKEVHNIDDLETRQHWRDKLREPFFTHEDIEAQGYTWIADLVRKAGFDQFSLGCSVVINGGPATRTLGSLTSDEVESIEIYGADIFKNNAGSDAFVSRAKAAALGRATAAPRKAPIAIGRAPEGDALAARVPVTNYSQARFENQGVGLHCPSSAIYVWLR